MGFPARYGGVCSTCGGPISVGEMIVSAFGKGYSHADHSATSIAAGVTQRNVKPAPTRRDGVQQVPDGTVGTCERCSRVAVVYSVKLTGKKRRIQVCSTCHSALISPLRQ